MRRRRDSGSRAAAVCTFAGTFPPRRRRRRRDPGVSSHRWFKESSVRRATSRVRSMAARCRRKGGGTGRVSAPTSPGPTSNDVTG